MSNDVDGAHRLEPLGSDFSLDEVRLPYDKWEKLQRERRSSLSAEARTWLDKWDMWDFACSPMADEERRLIRLGHYLGWFHYSDR
jgi:hypothetical protein